MYNTKRTRNDISVPKETLKSGAQGKGKRAVRPPRNNIMEQVYDKLVKTENAHPRM